jgi:hypothetical protein
LILEQSFKRDGQGAMTVPKQLFGIAGALASERCAMRKFSAFYKPYSSGAVRQSTIGSGKVFSVVFPPPLGEG